MALLGALAAAGGGRRGCVLRVVADAITFYCGGGSGDVIGGGDGGGGVAGRGLKVGSTDLDDDGDGGPADYYLRAAAGRGRVVTAAAAGGTGAAGRLGDYFRPVRSVSITGGSGSGGGSGGVDGTDYYYDVNGTAASVFVNGTTGIETYLNGSYNHTMDVQNVEDLTNYIFVITIGIILGAMILTTICGKH